MGAVAAPHRLNFPPAKRFSALSPRSKTSAAYFLRKLTSFELQMFACPVKIYWPSLLKRQLASGSQLKEESGMETKQTIGDQAARTPASNDRLESIGWGLFLIITGVTLLEREVDAPLRIWLIGGGLIMLGLNAVRYLSGIKTSSFSIGLGAVALAAGLASAFSVKLIGVLIMPSGASIILRPFFAKKTNTRTRPEVANGLGQGNHGLG
jgi:hypothetical protein